MDKVDATSINSEGTECPPIPIKTYKWEDIRRSRIKGAYPWTHLQKGPYDEIINPDIFTMDYFRRNKSTSTLGSKSESGVIIEEIIDSENEKINDNDNNKEDKYDVKEMADSSGDDNISQYLDKPDQNEELNEPGPSTNNDRKDRAKSEEPKRKRKLSIESSYSRISMKSLSQLGIVKRLKEAKDKIRMPKFPSFPKLDRKQKSEKQETETTEAKETKKDKKSHPHKDEKPVYIYIPLTLPPGETDEFSHYADEELLSTTTTAVTATTMENDSSKTEEGVQEETENSEKKDNIQMIILTAPSDDEILDDSSIPDTPSEKDKQLDKASIDALKNLAKNVVDEFSPEVRNELQSITEERSSEEKEKVPDEKMIVDSKEEEKSENVTETASVAVVEEIKATEEKKDIEIKLKDAEKLADELKVTDDMKINEETAVKNEETSKSVDIENGKNIKSGKSKKGGKDKKKQVEESKEEANVKQTETSEITKIEGTIDDQIENEPRKEDVPIKKNEVVREKILIDEEDGLKLSDRAIELINEELAKENLPKLNESELKSSLKAQEPPGSPPSIKKKVSFKRKNKPDDDYEIIEVPKNEVKGTLTLGTSQSMSVDEEKTYLDDKIIKTASLEEDYNKWSKNLDHEYEPVNPPPEDVKIVQQTPPSIEKSNDSTNELILKESSTKPRKIKPSDTNVVRIPLHEDVVIVSSGEDTDTNNENAQQMQDRLEAKYFNAAITEANVTPSSTNKDHDKDDGKNMLTRIEDKGKKIKDAFNMQTCKFKTRIKGMKKPNISMPQKPRFDKIKIQRIKDSMPKLPDTSKFKLPKIPEKSKISLPSFTLPKKGTATSKLKQRQFSTESNAGDSKMKIFDFSTYPRLFKSKKKDNDLDDVLESATIPRAKDKKSKTAPKTDNPVYIRIPLHSEESMERMESIDANPNKASHTRYNEDIDMDEAYLKENQEIHKASPFSSKFIERWKHGTFHANKSTPEPEPVQQQKEVPIESPELRVTDLDNSDEQNHSQSSNDPRIVSSGSLGDIHGRGVIEEINEDEFFVRQKGISQDNIEVGEYLSSEIREAFKNPVNPLRQMQDESYDKEYELDISDQSIEETPRKRSIKKPKRKRTPHVSQEKIAYDQESITTEPEEYPKEYPPPGRPKRRSRKGQKKPEVVPYQETIPAERQEEFPSTEILPHQQYITDDRLQEMQMYENGHMKGIEQPEILISNSYQREYRNDVEDFADDNGMPNIPPRKHRSLKSLTASEHDSIIGEYNRDFDPEEMEAYRMEHEYIIPTPELEPPVRPTRSRTRSQSQIPSNVDEDSIKYVEDESFTSESIEPCIEPTCVRDLRDSMGYAIIDKNRHIEPPLPPPRMFDAPKTPPRRRRGKLREETKFFTVPRQLNDTPPTRPLRNYSTLGSTNGKKRVSLQNLTDEEKENVDISQYSEIPDDDQSRKLQSGEVLQKMKDRPLPAPPRPPRKPRGARALRDITNEEIISNIEKEVVEEAEMSTQTEPLPDDFVCEEVVQESHDRVIIPGESFDREETITHGSLIVQPLDNAQIIPESQLSRERIIPIAREHFYENEISEIPEDFLNLKSPELPPKETHHEVAREKIEQPKQTEVETLKAQKLQVSDLDVDRLTVNELLANKIKVSEIDSGNIQVSEINSQGGNLIVSGIELPQSFLQELVDKLQSASQSQQQQSLQQVSQAHIMIETQSKQEEIKKQDNEQKKTPTELKETESKVIPERPPRNKHDDVLDQIEDTPEDELTFNIDIPERPPRIKHEQFEQQEPDDKDLESQVHDASEDMSFDVDTLVQEYQKQFQDDTEILLREPEEFFEDIRFQKVVEIPLDGTDIKIENIPRITDTESVSNTENDNPPPRPPQPRLNEEDFVYLPSQPPPSFYTLRSPIFSTEFLEDDIPLPPRRRRHRKQHIKDTTSSDDNLAVQRRSCRRSKTPEASIPELAGQLTRACASEANRQFKRLISYMMNNVLDNTDGKQDLHVTIVLLLVLIAGLILLGFGDGKTVHHHHWEYFNPPKNL